MRRWGRGAWAPLGMTLALAMGLAGCGGSESPLGVGPSDAGGDATSTGPVPDGVYTLDNVCETTAPKVCELRKACCEKSSGFDEATASGVRRPTASKTWLKSKLVRPPSMARASTPASTRSSPSSTSASRSLMTSRRRRTRSRTAASSRAKVGEGAACTRDERPVQAQRHGRCLRVVQRLEVQDDPHSAGRCRLRIKDDLDALCAAGLYCDVTPAGPAPWIGVCKTALSSGRPMPARPHARVWPRQLLR